MSNVLSTSGVGCETLVETLRAEFGAVMADRILEAEAADFLWEGRIRERYLGQHVAHFCDDEVAAFDELSRVAVLSLIAGRWSVGLCLVDGEGCVADLLWKRSYQERYAAEQAFLRAR